jgi:hypothetical protein
MLLPTALALGLLARPLAQSPASNGEARDPGVRIWVSDTLYQVGAGARVYVKLREPGHLMVLHADAMGRIQVLYPVAPAEQTAVPAGDPFEVSGSDDGATFRVEARGRGTLLAVRSPRPFQFDPLRHGDRWDYAEALLLQPTAGNGYAALLDIADRVADGQPYDYDVTAYGTPGAPSSRSAADTVCFSCLAARPRRSASNGTTGTGSGAVAIGHSYAAADNSSVVDCSGANLVDSFCGVQDNRVTNTYTDNSSYESNTVVYPVYVPFFVPFRRVVRPPPPTPPPPPPAIALPRQLRLMSRRLVPPAPRPRPQIVVIQPTAPSHATLTPDQPEPAEPVVVAATAAAPRAIGPRIARTTRPPVTGPSPMVPLPQFMAPAPSPATAVARPTAAAVPRTFVPTRAQLRSINAARR